ncbi:MAG TPA: sigma-54 dependent transcriptional regulator [Gammaproteobacteria bacterium]|nr:sigma-54 dependent transcriptional regulator [Gammaproteobacteria bacterium]
MTKETLNVLLSDECPSNRYLEQAFKMLDMPFHALTPNDLPAFIKKHKDNELILLACHHHAEHIKAHQDKPEVLSTLIASEGNYCDIKASKTQVCLTAPFTLPQFKSALHDCHAHLKALTPEQKAVFKQLIGDSEAIQKVKEMITQVASSNSNILILGESGTGKNIIASCIHQLSERKRQTFVPLNCGAIPSELIESELFGHEKGAFTGAVTRRPGRFEIADKGTLFLDEIGDMPLPMQVKLLRVIQEGVVERVGSTTSIQVDVRLIAATNQNLEQMIEQHLFREDLYYRLNVIPITVPSLRERPTDIPHLIDHHQQKVTKRFPNHAIFSKEAIEAMCQYDWPGNIRELANFVERMVVLHHDSVIEGVHVEEQFQKSQLKHHLILPTEAEHLNIKEYLCQVEQQIIKIALEKSNGVLNAAADYLKLGKSTLSEKIKKYNLVC